MVDSAATDFNSEPNKSRRAGDNHNPTNLPPEILCEIFYQLVLHCERVYANAYTERIRRRYPLPPSPSPYAWIVVTHVCRHWRDIAVGSPGLWTTISYKQPECVRTFIARSRQMPLQVHAHHLDDQLAEAVMPDIAHECARLQVFRLNAPALCWDALVGAPVLEELHLTDPLSIEERDYVPDWTSFDLPRLKRVRPEKVPFPPAERVVNRRSITSLWLSTVTPQRTTAALVEMLAGLQALEVLSLRDMLKREGLLPYPPSSPRRAAFPRLRSLHVGNSDLGITCTSFLNLITIPRAAAVSFEGHISFPPVSHPTTQYHRHIIEAIGHWRAVGSAGGMKGQEDLLTCRIVYPTLTCDILSFLSIKAWASDVSLDDLDPKSLTYPTPLISLSWGLIPIRDANTCIQLFFENIASPRLHKFYFAGPMADALSDTCVQKLHTVRELCVDHSMDSFRGTTKPEKTEAGLLGHCMRFVGSSKSSPRNVVFPNLEHLTLRCVKWHQYPADHRYFSAEDVLFDIKGMLRKRKAAKAPLKTLTLRRCMNVDGKAVTALVRDGLVGKVDCVDLKEEDPDRDQGQADSEDE